ncbi:alanine--tRNA ligase [Candidatus Parcubacteria bacterium]|nr:alanine--tRNA ligase [Candidatus Parcubacteria bacterium]
MKANEVRSKYLKFFEGKGHRVIPSASLVPQNDPTVLFTTAGMHPLVPYLLGERHPLGKRLCNSQKCVRTGDIDDVGDKTHLTFFEMLGNWSLGDYFKKEAIEWSFEFLTEELKLPLKRLAVSVFQGEVENNIPKDNEAAQIWQGLGVKPERIAFLSREDNWWGPAGATGPCGPDTEMFFWTGQDTAPEKFDQTDKNWVEIWNDVFMQYNKNDQGEYEPLKQKNVDTGMGLERITAILQGKDNVYETELFTPIIEKISKISGKPYLENEKAMRIIADHIKAAIFILAEQVYPDKDGQGYVLRRLIRNAAWQGIWTLKIQEYFVVDLVEPILRIYDGVYSELGDNKDFIISRLKKEEEKFHIARSRAKKMFDALANRGEKFFSGKQVFDLYQNYGLRIEIVKELAKEKGIDVDEQGFQEEFKKHQVLSRTASVGQFKAGLADHSEQTTKYHTATHLLLAALRKVLGGRVEQRGSNITAQRIRFDFSCLRKLTQEEIKQVESLVNEAIKNFLEVKVEEMTVEKAIEQGAMASFREKYPEKVKVFTIFDSKTGEVFSREICSGPHVCNLKSIGHFKIIKEESSSSGVRRIKAVLQE